ncbi:tumor necrosis factor-like [Porites lutea]|uniref:tumor necrosis factor-like n=1 Tax=Porites lutea TaxID=51062 RepID=UPI003CC6316B
MEILTITLGITETRLNESQCEQKSFRSGDTGAKGDNGTPCQCSLQDPKKPSAHIEAANLGDKTYQANIMIKDWSVSAAFSHLAGGMKYQDGKLTVPTTGRYYIYLQIYCKTQGRVYVRANNRVITMIQSPTTSSAMYVGGVFNLTAGDVITFLSAYANFRVFMYSYHTYFGAYLI